MRNMVLPTKQPLVEKFVLAMLEKHDGMITLKELRVIADSQPQWGIAECAIRRWLPVMVEQGKCKVKAVGQHQIVLKSS